MGVGRDSGGSIPTAPTAMHSLPCTPPRPAREAQLVPPAAQRRSPGLPRARLRPLTAADAAAFSDFLQALDPASRRLRFHGAINPRSSLLLQRLVASDSPRHRAWVAVVQAEDGREQIVGEARCVGTGGPDAELAMAVLSAWRGRGLADALFATLHRHAREAGLRELRALVQADNPAMQAFLRRQGFERAERPVPGEDAGVVAWVQALERPHRSVWFAAWQGLLARCRRAGLGRVSRPGNDLQPSHA